PPSQRWLTKCWPEACAASAIASCAWRLVPTNSTLPPRATVCWTKSSARANSGTDCDRSMMWTPLRSPKMYGFILGFQRWVWWPKCAPASSNCCMVTTVAAIVILLPVLPRWSRMTRLAAGTGMIAPPVGWRPRSESNPSFQGLGTCRRSTLDRIEQNRNITPPQRRLNVMTAALGALPFLATLWLVVVLGAKVLEESGAKIAAALKGVPLIEPA